MQDYNELINIVLIQLDVDYKNSSMLSNILSDKSIFIDKLTKINTTYTIYKIIQNNYPYVDPIEYTLDRYNNRY